MEANPKIAAISPWIGQTSNVWMHRQFAQLADQLTTIFTWESHNEDQFPLPDTDIRFVPDAFANPLRGLPRTLDSMLSPRTGGTRFGSRFDRWFTRQLVGCGAQAVLGQFGHYGMLAEVACRKIGVPVFAHFHGHDLSARLRRKRYRTSLESHWHDFAGKIVVATYQQNYLLEHGHEPDSVALIPCGAPTRSIAAQADTIRSSQPIDRNVFTFLFVGRLVEKKDPLSMLRSFERCWQERPEVRLRIVGAGPLEAQCHQWVADRSPAFANAITFLGAMSPKNVIKEMATANALAQHSRTASDGDMEGWPVSIAEAMAASLPIIATRHAGIVDQVGEGDNGYLCNEGDWETMAKDMTVLVSDRELADRMSRQSLKRAMGFDSADQIEKLRHFINDRVAHRSQRRRAA
ncbi:putative glycosyltransferase EpsD [Rubripirellula tenax]|uniref:Putative glycosyltransferase EpsD n=1 Tax=Rubripirellula tenax TaxID=2528015 RepID=A0A5C6FE34_9BACT|nr:glycosyltransferase family 4 protein [Rubripirellula tenax]TWU58454.1 putative glycosyltransferase EpsD [Rubripirellula tenax]